MDRGKNSGEESEQTAVKPKRVLVSRAEAVLCREQKKRDLKKCQVKKIKLGWLCWCWESVLVVVLVVALLYIGLLVKK